MKIQLSDIIEMLVKKNILTKIKMHSVNKNDYLNPNGEEYNNVHSLVEHLNDTLIDSCHSPIIQLNMSSDEIILRVDVNNII